MNQGTDFPGVTIVYWCHDGAGNVLLAKRSVRARDEQGTWDCGGGALDAHEQVEQALRREINEEYGTSVMEFEHLGYRDVHREHSGVKTHWIALDFKVLVDRKAAKNNEPHKFDAVEWFPLKQLPKPLHSQLPYFIEKYRTQLMA